MRLLNSLIRITAPDSPVLSLEQARAQCRVDVWGSPAVHPDDALLESYVQAATDELDGVDGWLNRALVTQTWMLTLNYFPARAIRMPLPPLQSVTEIEYDAPDGTATVLDPGDYRVITDSDPGYIAPKIGGSWPSTRSGHLGGVWPHVHADADTYREGAVRITYVAGYGDPDDVPEIIKNYIRMRVAQQYNFRELTVMKVGTLQPVPFARESLEAIRMRGVKP